MSVILITCCVYIKKSQNGSFDKTFLTTTGLTCQIYLVEGPSSKFSLSGIFLSPVSYFAFNKVICLTSVSARKFLKIKICKNFDTDYDKWRI